MIEQHLRDFLRDDDDITDRVEHRIRAGNALESDHGELIIITEISNVPQYTLIGEAGKHDKVVQVVAYSATPGAAFSLAELVRNRLSGYRGVIGDGDASSVESCRIISGGAGQDQPRDKSDRWIYSYRYDFAMFEDVSIPTLA